MRLTMIRVDATIVDRVRTYATTHALSLGEAAARLLTAGLDHLAARSAGGTARLSALSPEERSELGRRAVMTRWHKP